MSMHDEFWKGGAQCAVDGTITQVVAAPTPAGLNIVCPTGTEFELLSVLLSVGTVGAARTCLIAHVNASDAEITSIAKVALDDDEIYRGPILYVITDDQTANTANAAAGIPYHPLIVASGEKIRIVIQSAANTEVLTVKVRLRIRGAIPTITAIGAGISVATFTPTVI